MILTLLHYQ